MPSPNKKTVKITYYSHWGGLLQDAPKYFEQLPRRDLGPLVSDPSDQALLDLARLDCDWDGENLRCFSELSHPEIEFAPTKIVGIAGLLDFLQEEVQPSVIPWLIMIAQQPQTIESVLDRILTLFTQKGGKVFYWAYDEASRYMPCFKEGLARHLSVLVHDEMPLDNAVAVDINPACIVHNRSWLANIVPYSYPFVGDVRKQIVFLGSKLGFTPHRKRQVDYLKQHFKDRFTAIHDHSIPVSQRGEFGRYKVHFCPEGRTFTTPAMRYTHTDRPFWSGCVGQVPVVEDSKLGGRLQGLTEDGLILRYTNGDLKGMVEACEQALETPLEQRKRIYDHFNENESIGPNVAQMIAEAVSG
ncbi:MAG: hypothetical protein RPV21_09530 [Candidatus Sedimenticola sp. (ex Thyasira tokunagai)]